VSVETDLHSRGDDQCELCRATDDLVTYAIPPSSDGSTDQSALICSVCRDQIDGSTTVEVDRWRVLTDTMWSQVPAVQVMAWRMLRKLRAQAWAAEALEMLYLEDDVRSWAEAGDESGDGSGDGGHSGESVIHRDGNGAVLSSGDTVTLIKDLNVKGAGFTAKRGTAVRSISLVQDNAAHIEGRINGQQIVILTEFVKKSG